MLIIPTGTGPLWRTIMALVLIASIAALGEEGTTITASTVAPAVDEQFTVSVILTSTAGFSCWGQALTWDTSKLRLDGQATIGSAFGTVVPDSRSTAVIQSSGQVRSCGYFQAAGPSYPNNAPATGTSAQFTFTRIASGSTTLNCPVKSGGVPFGLVLIDIGNTERSPTASSLTLTDPVTSTVAAPSFSPAGGSYSSAQSVIISTSTAGATIHYRLDGSVPTPASPTYTSPVAVTSSVTITALAIKAGMIDSAAISSDYVITVSTVAAPTFSPAEGTYSTAQAVTIASLTTGATIHFTVDGSTPTAASPTYNGAIPVASTSTIKAIAMKDGLTESAVRSVTFTISSTPAGGGSLGSSGSDGSKGCGLGSGLSAFALLLSCVAISSLCRRRAIRN